jgi:hypothetical protein
MTSRKNVRLVAAALIGVVLLACGGWAAARQIKSPAQVAADTAAPRPSQLTAKVTTQTLSAEVITRGTVRYGLPTPISLPVSNLKGTGTGTGTPIVGRLPKPGAKLRERSVAMTISGRPMIVLQGATPMYRDLGPGTKGADVLQLEHALARAGLGPGPVDGRYDAATAAAVAGLYRRVGSTPFGVTDSQFEKVNTAASNLSAARDKTLQARLALRVAQRGATPAEINQARLDAAAIDESVDTTRTAIGAARGKIADARDLQAIARRAERDGDPTARRDVAAAGIDVTTKQNALNDAIQAQNEAQHAVNILAPDALPADVELARATLRTATGKVAGARSDVAAAEGAYRAAENVLRASSTKARDDGRKAARDLAVARSDLRDAQRTLRTQLHKRSLARTRVRILRAPGPSGIERQTVAAALTEERRTRRELARLSQGLSVQVPADEILFVPSTPANVDAVTAKRGTPATGDLITVTNTRLAIDSALSVEDAKLVKVGQKVKISEPDLHLNLTGTVRQVARQNGTNGVDPGKRAVEIQPNRAPSTLVNTSVALKIAVKSSKGRVLTVPTSAVSTAADGDQRIEVLSGGRQTFITVDVGLQAQGFYEISPRIRGALKEGDEVVIGASGASAAGKGPSNVPVAPVPSSGGQGSTSTSGTGARSGP